MSHVRIEKVSNGYIVHGPLSTHVHTSLEDVFADLLQRFEGRTAAFRGDMYGKVVIRRHDGSPDEEVQA